MRRELWFAFIGLIAMIQACDENASSRQKKIMSTDPEVGKEDIETEDSFAVAERQRIEFLKRIASAEEQDIFGIVDAGGAAGARNDDEPWSLILHLAGWKASTGELRKEEMRVEMPVNEDELDQYRAEIGPYDIVHLRGRVALHPVGRLQAEVTSLVSWTHRDPELESYAAELQKPVVHSDKDLGDFLLDRSINWFRGEADWRGQRIRLDLSVDSEEAINESLRTAKALWKNQDEWAEKVGDFAVNELLELKNTSWLKEDEAKISPEAFKKSMRLESITVYPNGDFEFWHDDGDLFWGHSIQVSGNLKDGFTDADIPG